MSGADEDDKAVLEVDDGLGEHSENPSLENTIAIPTSAVAQNPNSEHVNVLPELAD